jgi:hypothetical protein
MRPFAQKKECPTIIRHKQKALCRPSRRVLGVNRTVCSFCLLSVKDPTPAHIVSSVCLESWVSFMGPDIPMFPGESSSQYPSSQNRNPTEDLSKVHPLSPSGVPYPSTLIDSTSPVFQQGIQIPGSSWPINRPIPAVQGGGSESSRAFPASIHPQSSTTSLNSSTSLPSSFVGSESSLSAQPSLDSVRPASEQQLLSVETSR